ncbi:MAG: hypothetical protein ACYCQJ_09425 [Nitrososphaerales archaeon]
MSDFAKEEFHVRLVSNYLRKRYEDIAHDTTIPKSIAAFLMGDKTKIAQEGIHLDLFYGRNLRFNEKLIEYFHNSGLAEALNIENPKIPQSNINEIAELKATIQELRAIIQAQQHTIQNLSNSKTKHLDP